MESCIFCRIVKREIPASIVYEDELVVAFEDITPVAPVHLLIIPKRHLASLLVADESDQLLLGHIACVAARLARDQGIAESGFRLVTNTNHDAGQSVFHIHFHLLGGRKMTWPPG
jgi:histidine triad (HIT) family protein